MARAARRKSRRRAELAVARRRRDGEGRRAERDGHAVAALDRGRAPDGLLEEHPRQVGPVAPAARRWLALDARRTKPESDHPARSRRLHTATRLDLAPRFAARMPGLHV